MKINKISVNNFKSLVQFEIKLPDFICIIGLNGAGKSSLLQFIDFLGQQMRGDMEGWLNERHWKAGEIHSKLITKRNVDFTIELSSDQGPITWEASYNTYSNQCTMEKIRTADAELDLDKGQLNIFKREEDGTRTKNKIGKIPFSYEGSVMSQLTDDTLPASIRNFRDYIRGINSLDMLSPEHLRKRKKEADGKIGFGGDRLAPFLHEMARNDFSLLQTYLMKAYPHLEKIQTKSLQAGWKKIIIGERYGVSKDNNNRANLIQTEARHMNDGMLRLIAILAALRSKEGFLLFDEIENGINPELINFVIERLVESSKQIMVTTHSPMILNYIEDDIAKDSVIYLYRTREGYTHALPFFSIPSQMKKLQFMGPGEAFVDTDLNQLQEEIYTMQGGS